jgi:hypothetical protein
MILTESALATAVDTDNASTASSASRTPAVAPGRDRALPPLVKSVMTPFFRADTIDRGTGHGAFAFIRLTLAGG